MPKLISIPAPPSLPQAPDVYDRAYQDQLNNIMRLYLNQLYTATRAVAEQAAL